MEATAVMEGPQETVYELSVPIRFCPGKSHFRNSGHNYPFAA